MDINLEDLELSLTSTESLHASPRAPAFSPITPEHSLSVTCSSTPQQTDPLSSPDITASQHVDQPDLVPISCSSPKPATSKWSGFKVVIDNIDMHIKPRHQTFERQARSIHYVNAYATLDRIDLSDYSTQTTGGEVSIASLLPTSSDRESVLDNFAVLAGRILCQCIPALQELTGLETSHIHHTYSMEMNRKSDIVCNPHVTCKT